MSIAKYIFLFSLALVGFSSLSAQTNSPQNRKESVEIADKFYQNGLQLQGQGNFVASIVYFDSSVYFNPRVAEVYFSQGSSYEAVGDFAKALLAYERAINLQPSFEGAKFRKGVCLYSLQLYRESIEVLSQLIANNGFREETTAIFYAYSPSGEVRISTDNQMNAEYFLYRGLAYTDLRDERKALADLDSAVMISGQASNYLVNRGLALQKLGKESLAIRDYEQALSQDPENESALVNLFSLDANKGNEYVTEHREVIAGIMAPELLAQLAFEAFNGKRYEEALHYYTKALSMAPRHPDWLMNRAMCYGKLGQLEMAETELLSVLKLPDFSGKAYLHLANMLFFQERHEEAISYYKLYLAIDPYHGAAYFNRAIAYNKMGENELACEDLAKATEFGVKNSLQAQQSICNN